MIKNVTPMKGWVAFYDQSLLSSGSFSGTSSAAFLDNKKTLNKFPQSPKIQDMSRIKILTYTLDKYSLQTRTVSFPDHKKLLKEVDSG